MKPTNFCTFEERDSAKCADISAILCDPKVHLFLGFI
jgi:hypothetical protein